MRSLHQDVVIAAQVERILEQLHVARRGVLVWKGAKRETLFNAVGMGGLEPLRVQCARIAVNKPGLPAIEHGAIAV